MKGKHRPGGPPDPKWTRQDARPAAPPPPTPASLTMLVAPTRVCDINQDNSNSLKITVHRHGDTKVRSYNEKSHGATCAATAQLLQQRADGGRGLGWPLHGEMKSPA